VNTGMLFGRHVGDMAFELCTFMLLDCYPIVSCGNSKNKATLYSSESSLLTYTTKDAENISYHLRYISHA